jgi:outer membrane protein assembly factor BamD (BamD/ComL family)
MFRKIFIGLALLISAGCASVPYQETEKKHTWLSLNKPAEATPELEFARAERFRAADDKKAACKAYRALVETWPRSEQAPIAQLRLAETLEARGELQDAFEAYDVLMDRYVGQFDYKEVVDKQFQVAQRTMEKRRGKFLLFGGFKAPERAIPMFESIIRHAPHGDNAAEAQYLIGTCNELIDELELAVVAYMNTQHRYPESPFAEKAAFGRAHCQYLLTEENPNDEEALEQAYAAAVVFQNSYPDSSYGEVIGAYQKSLLRRRTQIAYERAVFYDRNAHRPKAALICYENFVKMYPNSDWTAAAQARIDQIRPTVEKEPQP